MWEQGIKILQSTERKDLELLISLYFNSKYDEVGGSLLQLLVNFYNHYSFEFSTLTDRVEELPDVMRLVAFLDSIGRSDQEQFLLYLSELDHPMKVDIISRFSSNVVDSSMIIGLYETSTPENRLLLIESGGYIETDEQILDWLTELLYEESEEIGSLALISLTKHGNAGLASLSRSMLDIPQRLQLTSIDLILRNRYSAAYDQLVNLLYSGSQDAIDKILRGFAELDEEVIPFIIMALSSTDYEVSMRLLALLEMYDAKLYLNKILFLLFNYEVRDYLLERLFLLDEREILYALIMDDKFGVRTEVIDIALNKQNPVLLQDRDITSTTITYLLSFFSLESVVEYMLGIGKDQLYIEDYKHLHEIYSALENISRFESLNGEEEYVTEYFEMLKRLSEAEDGETRFFKGLEEWLVERDPVLLEESREIKNSSISRAEVMGERQIYLTNLETEQLGTVIGYEESQRIIYNHYRNITYRFKVITYNIILASGYVDLLP